MLKSFLLLVAWRACCFSVNYGINMINITQYVAKYRYNTDFQIRAYDGFFSNFSTKTYVVGTQHNRLDETTLLGTKICVLTV